jgi:DNA-directed RNA polymerase subunit E'/Rpb7
MQNLLNKIDGKFFKYNGKIYTVRETKIVNQKGVILTDGSSFVKTKAEMEVFLDEIEILEVLPVKSFIPGCVTGVDYYKPSDELVLKSSPLQAEIVVAESNAQKVSNKLMEVFNSLADSPTEETYKKASAMVNVSNSIVAVQMAQIKFLSLKK